MCGRLSNGPQRCPHPNPQEPVNVTLRDKRDLADVMKFKGLEMGRLSRITQVDPIEPRESLEVKEEGWRVRVGEGIRKEVV